MSKGEGGFVELTPVNDDRGRPLVAGGNKFKFVAERDNLTYGLFYSRDRKKRQGGKSLTFPSEGRKWD
jgi:hypothetical protein